MATNAMLPPSKIDPLTGLPVPASTPPPSPTLGFSLWSQDPLNSMKVQPAMTAADKPLQPGASQQPQMASAAANPPAVAPMASSAPPVNPQQQQLGADTAELRRLQQSGAAVNQVKNPFLRTLGQVGNIAAPFLLGQGAMAIPGTSAHNLWLQDRAAGRVAQDQAAQAADLAQQTGLAGLAKTQAETAAIPITAGLKRQQYLAALAGKGLREDESTGAIVPDESSPVYQQQQLQQGLIQAHTDNFKASSELKAAQEAFEKTKNDPNSPAFKLAKERLSVAQQNANAAGLRANAYMGRYLQSAYNIDAQGNVLPGAPIIGDESGAQTVVGTANAPLAAKSQANVAQFNDIEGATNNIESAAIDLVNKGGTLNSPTVAAAIDDPKTTSGQWLQGEFANSGLSPEQRNYVIQVKAYKENLQGLRKSAGGGVSDSQVDRLMSLAPGAATPDLDYLLRQTGQIRAMRSRLAAGVTTAKGGVKVQGTGNPMAPPTTGPKVGDVVTLKDGTKVTVKVVHPDGSFD